MKGSLEMNEKVMVVDDDPSIRKTVELILGARGHPLKLVASGAGCLEELREGFRGLVLMDIMMPEMDGWDTITAMVDQGLYEGNVVCMLTAVSDPGPRLVPLTEYVLDYVRKPFTAEDLIVVTEESAPYIRGSAVA